MTFKLEAVFAKKGDALIVHCGTEQSPRWMLIDGGTGVWTKYLRKRLRQIRDAHGLAQMPLDLVMVSHIDDDHIDGILSLVKVLAQEDAPEFKVETLWLNAFDRLLATTIEEIVGKLNLPEDDGFVASVKQGIDLSEFAEEAAARGRLLLNQFFAGDDDFPALIVANDANTKPFEFGDTGLRFTVLAPNVKRLKALQVEWDRELRRRELALDAAQDEGEIASLKAIDPTDAFTLEDTSKYNLASIVVLVERDGRRILLTGDATAADIVEGLVRAKHLPEEALMDGPGLDADQARANGESVADDPVRKVHSRRFDVLKVPHHGSPNNVTVGFFRRVTADHYFISGDGDHGNPNVHTLEMLREARSDDEDQYSIYFTLSREQIANHEQASDNPESAKRIGLERLAGWLAEFEDQGVDRPKLIFREDDDLSIALDL